MYSISTEAKFYACRKIVRTNEIMTLMYHDQVIRIKEEFFLAHPGGGAEVEGRIISPGPLRGGRIHVDLFRDRTRGIFTITTTAFNHERYYFPLWSIWHRHHRVFSHLGTGGWYTDNLLEVHTDNGMLSIQRNHDTHWGPRIFRGRERHWGPVTIMVA